jgi:type II secretory ATPase GspE/PulE/Tfp pilus assembly ATPase PilB-like protein
MGIKPYMLAPSLNLVVSQRLVRKVCPYCVTKKDPDYAESAEIAEVVRKINDLDPNMRLDFHRQIPKIV